MEAASAWHPSTIDLIFDSGGVNHHSEQEIISPSHFRPSEGPDRLFDRIVTVFVKCDKIYLTKVTFRFLLPYYEKRLISPFRFVVVFRHAVESPRGKNFKIRFCDDLEYVTDGTSLVIT